MLKVGIVGCGNIFTMHATSCDYLPNAQLVGVCDIKKDRADAAAKKYNVTAYYDYKDLIDPAKIDVVHLCVPHYLHPIISRYALEQGVNVLCEKPISINYEDGEYNARLAEEKNLRYGIIFQCRYNETSRLIKENLDNGKLGKIISARCTLTWCKPDSYYSLSDWKGTWDKEGGGVVIDQAIHSIDLVRWIIDDEVESVSCNMANRRHKIVDVEDSAEGFITFKNGTTYGFWCMNNYSCDEPIEIRLNCERGKVVFGYNEALIQYKDGTVEEVKKAPQSFKGKDYWGNWHVRQLSNFYRACLDLEPLEIDGEEALKTHKLICRIYDEGGMKK